VSGAAVHRLGRADEPQPDGTASRPGRPASEDHFDTWDNADDPLRERTIDDYNASGDAV